ncbi:NAD(P)-binding protein [Xylariaceae sp. FL1019]|nr:NAD(P)-binding protein [Xylariaceae sp. FL1019]
MSAIKRVAIAGATGNLGPAIVTQLIKAGFEVTALTRQDSTNSLPNSVKVKAVDYDSVDSLSSALENQHALISTLGSLALSKQLKLVQAAINAKVNRFIPSEFGSDTSNPKTSKLPVFADKVVVANTLAEAAEKGSITYTIIRNGPFFDWTMKAGLLLNIPERSVILYDGGNRLLSTSTLETIGKGVVGVLKNPEATKNRGVYIHDTAITMKQLHAWAEKATGTSWNTQVVSVENDILAPAWAATKSESPDFRKAAIPFIITSIWGEGYGGHFEKVDNELLGLKEMTEAEAEAVVVANLK